MIGNLREFRSFDAVGLYENTLYHSQTLRPWAIDKRGIYLGLELRKDFVLSYLKEPGNFNFKETQYFHFIKNGQKFLNFGDIYEGNSSWRYANPDLLCKRYISLIKKTIKQPTNHDLIKFYDGEKIMRMKVLGSLINRLYFEFKHPTYVIYNNTKKVHRKPEGSFKSCMLMLRSLTKCQFDIRLGLVPIVTTQNDVEIMTNGCHRLAIMYALSIHQNQPQQILCYVR